MILVLAYGIFYSNIHDFSTFIYFLSWFLHLYIYIYVQLNNKIEMLNFGTCKVKTIIYLY